MNVAFVQCLFTSRADIYILINSIWVGYVKNEVYEKRRTQNNDISMKLGFTALKIRKKVASCINSSREKKTIQCTKSTLNVDARFLRKVTD